MTIIGTCYFPTRRHAESYYRFQWGNAYAAADYYRDRHGRNTLKDAIDTKLKEGEIHIGKPPRKPGDKLILIDNGLRYGIEERDTKMTFKISDMEALEGGAETQEEFAQAMQRAINGGDCWRLQGSYGRAAMGMLDRGECMLGTQASHDAYGNRVPARSEIKEGTKGSRGLVVERMGEEWAKMLEDV